MSRYKINETINTQFLGEFPFLDTFGYEEGAEWLVDQSTLDQIDLSGDSQKTVEQACQNLYSQTKQAFFDPKLDASFQFYQLQKIKNVDGFDCYEKIVGDINNNGGMPGYLDDAILIYEQLTTIRMMLKDGMFETALRYWFTDIIPISPFTSEQNTFYISLIEALVLKYGTTQDIIDLLKTVPKNNYPFGSTGAP